MSAKRNREARLLSGPFDLLTSFFEYRQVLNIATSAAGRSRPIGVQAPMLSVRHYLAFADGESGRTLPQGSLTPDFSGIFLFASR